MILVDENFEMACDELEKCLLGITFHVSGSGIERIYHIEEKYKELIFGILGHIRSKRGHVPQVEYV